MPDHTVEILIVHLRVRNGAESEMIAGLRTRLERARAASTVPGFTRKYQQRPRIQRLHHILPDKSKIPSLCRLWTPKTKLSICGVCSSRSACTFCTIFAEQAAIVTPETPAHRSIIHDEIETIERRTTYSERLERCRIQHADFQTHDAVPRKSVEC
jgi:hypothetical protein